MDFLGTKGAGRYKVRDPEYRYSLNPNSIDRGSTVMERSIAAYAEQEPDIALPFERRINFWANNISAIAADPLPDVRVLRSLLDRLNAVPTPDRGQSRFKNVIATATIRRECINAFLGAAYGLGDADVENRYARAVAAWQRDGFTTYYPKTLVNLNYLATRIALSRGDNPTAFRYATDPVMMWAVQMGRPYAPKWVATFHTFGIGTPRSPAKALAVYQMSNMPDDRIDAALIKANMGQHSTALNELREIAQDEKTSREGKRALRIYTELGGAPIATPTKPGFLELILAIPVAIVAVCVEHPIWCSANNNSGGSQGSSSPIGGPYPGQWQNLGEALDAMNDVERLGV
ncbi:hypothetical protein ACNI3Q_02635 [Sphingomonas sp. FW199]|uniref:hypothetical protein n=1 Tax=Sphingomonas sp. FW199 TaxID=3400217 RepID=UPI003CFB10D7